MTFKEILERCGVNHFPVVQLIGLREVDVFCGDSQKHAPYLDEFSEFGHVVIKVNFHGCFDLWLT